MGNVLQIEIRETTDALPWKKIYSEALWWEKKELDLVVEKWTRFPSLKHEKYLVTDLFDNYLIATIMVCVM